MIFLWKVAVDFQISNLLKCSEVIYFTILIQRINGILYIYIYTHSLRPSSLMLFETCCAIRLFSSRPDVQNIADIKGLIGSDHKVRSQCLLKWGFEVGIQGLVYCNGWYWFYFLFACLISWDAGLGRHHLELQGGSERLCQGSEGTFMSTH